MRNVPQEVLPDDAGRLGGGAAQEGGRRQNEGCGDERAGDERQGDRSDTAAVLHGSVPVLRPESFSDARDDLPRWLART